MAAANPPAKEKSVQRSDLDALKTEVLEQNERLKRDLHSERDARLRSEGAASVREAAPAPVAPTIYSPQELQKLVEAGTISETTRDDITRRQADDQRKTEILDEVRTEMAASQQATTIQTEIDRYAESYPDAFDRDKDSNDRKRVQEEFNFLLRMGEDPNSKLTELKALRAALGSVDRIGERTRERRPTHVEAGGSGGGAEPPAPDTSVPQPLKDNPKLKFHYDALIRQGMYSGYDDPVLVREMKFVRPSRRAS